MAEDLYLSGRLRGKTDAWVRKHLGTPDDEWEGDSGDRLRRWVIPVPDNTYMMILTSRNGVVVHWMLSTDPEAYDYDPYIDSP